MLLKNKAFMIIAATYSVAAFSQMPPPPMMEPPAAPMGAAPSVAPSSPVNPGQPVSAPGVSSGPTFQAPDQTSGLIKDLEKIERTRLIKEAKEKAGEGAKPSMPPGMSSMPMFPPGFQGAGGMPMPPLPGFDVSDTPKVVSIIRFDNVSRAIIETSSGEFMVKEGDEVDNFVITKISNQEVFGRNKSEKKAKAKKFEARYSASNQSVQKSGSINIPQLPKGNFVDSSGPDSKPFK